MKVFRVKNFERFQHYKDRSPPWIKLYNELLDDYEFGLLPDATKMHLIAIWLLASRSENRIPYDQAWVARRINANENVNLDLLLDSGFIVLDQSLPSSEQVASNAQAECLSRGEGQVQDIEQHNRADARDDLQKRTGNFQQAVVRAFADGNSPNLPETSRCGLWLSQGYQEDICLAVIAEIVRKKPSVTTLNYFDNAIKEAHASKAPPRQAVVMKAEEVDWDATLKTFKQTGHWSRWAGPDLDSPACRAPAEMLEKYGLVVNSGDVGHQPSPPVRRMNS